MFIYLRHKPFRASDGLYKILMPKCGTGDSPDEFSPLDKRYNPPFPLSISFPPISACLRPGLVLKDQM